MLIERETFIHFRFFTFPSPSLPLFPSLAAGSYRRFSSRQKERIFRSGAVFCRLEGSGLTGGKQGHYHGIRKGGEAPWM